MFRPICIKTAALALSNLFTFPYKLFRGEIDDSSRKKKFLVCPRSLKKRKLAALPPDTTNFRKCPAGYRMWQ
jgi:hypothetical protein